MRTRSGRRHAVDYLIALHAAWDNRNVLVPILVQAQLNIFWLGVKHWKDLHECPAHNRLRSALILKGTIEQSDNPGSGLRQNVHPQEILFTQECTQYIRGRIVRYPHMRNGTALGRCLSRITNNIRRR